MLLLLVACSSYELVAAEATFHVEPEQGDVGAFLDATVPMRLQLYGPEAYGPTDIELRPFHGFVQAPVQAEVACLGDAILHSTVANDQLAVFFLEEIGDYDQAVLGGNWQAGGRRTRQGGDADQIVELRFPCLPDPILHRAQLDWVIDRSAPIPNADVP